MPEVPIDYWEAFYCWEVLNNFRKSGFAGIESFDFADVIQFLKLRRIPDDLQLYIASHVASIDGYFKKHADKNKPKG